MLPRLQLERNARPIFCNRGNENRHYSPNASRVCTQIAQNAVFLQSRQRKRTLRPKYQPRMHTDCTECRFSAIAATKTDIMAQMPATFAVRTQRKAVFLQSRPAGRMLGDREGRRRHQPLFGEGNVSLLPSSSGISPAATSLEKGMTTIPLPPGFRRAKALRHPSPLRGAMNKLGAKRQSPFPEGRGWGWGNVDRIYPSDDAKSQRSAGFEAEEEGFEPPVPCSTTVFKTAAIDHSAIPPKGNAKVVKNYSLAKNFQWKRIR